MEEITTPIPISIPKTNPKEKKRRSLIIAIGLPLFTIIMIWLTTGEESAPLKVSDNKTIAKEEETFNPNLLSAEIQAYFNGELDIAEAHCLNTFYKDPFSRNATNNENIAKKIHEIKTTTENFLSLFSKDEIKKGVTQFKALKIMDTNLRQQFGLPFAGNWADQILRWESQIENYARRAYLEGYALLRTSPREALEKYRLALFLSSEKSKIYKKAQDAIRNLGLGLD